MGHVTDGVLRRSLDEPGSLADVDRRHLAGCPRCRTELDSATRDRDAVRDALDGGLSSDAHEASGRAVTDGEPVSGAWTRLEARRGREGDRPAVAVLTAGRRPARRSRGYQVAAGVAVGVMVVGGTAAAAASDWLPIFRTETVTPVPVSMDDVTSVSSFSDLAGLADYGDVTMPSSPEPTRVAGRQEALAATGIDAAEPSRLPAGVGGKPEYLVVRKQSLTFTFSAAKAERSARAGGLALPPVPEGLDGTAVRIEGGPAVVQAWMRSTGTPTLLIARALAPTASSRGASLEQVRDYLLALPGLSSDLEAQLRAVTGDGRSLPIPVLRGRMTSSTVTVAGSDATVVEAAGGYGAGVVWVSGGRLTAVAGPLDRDDVLRVARGLG